MKICKVCQFISVALGKKFMMQLLGHRYPKIFLTDIEKFFDDLDIVVVGGLKNRGWTTNDIDVAGAREDAVLLAQKLQKNGISNPIHYCGEIENHSHILCAYYGIKLALTGRGY